MIHMKDVMKALEIAKAFILVHYFARGTRGIKMEYFRKCEGF